MLCCKSKLTISWSVEGDRRRHWLGLATDGRVGHACVVVEGSDWWGVSVVPVSNGRA